MKKGGVLEGVAFVARCHPRSSGAAVSAAAVILLCEN
jgi:hypothetical protein